MKQRFVSSILVAVCLLTLESPAQEAKVTVKVVDEFLNPVTNADVVAGFYETMKPGSGWGSNQREQARVTDTNGLCTVSGKCNGGLEIGASKQGWYRTFGPSLFFTNSTVGKWQPWNLTVDLQLKKIGKPVAMYAKRFGEGKAKHIPEMGKPVGFDLIKGDWVAPHGIGEVSDFSFRMDQQLGGETKNGYQIHDSSLIVTFSNDGDGVQSVYVPPFKGSQMRLPRTAPEGGYETNFIRRAYYHEDGAHYERREDQNYFFRVRTKKDEKGQIVSALYGKIHGEIEFERAGDIRFTYYLNPTPNDRNLEFDQKQNLFKNLSSLEQVRDP